MKTSDLIAFDRSASARRYDDDGRMHVSISNVSKAAVNPYYGEEIPRWTALGLEPAKIYRLLRDPSALEASAPTFENNPLQIKHVHHKASAPQKGVGIGTVSNFSFEHPYLRSSMCIWDEEAIALIESEKMVQLSASYHYDAIMEPGEYEGQPYDGVMTNIRGNHIALVEEGRAGSDVVVSDSNPFTPKQETPAMKLTKLGLALKLALSAASPKIAQDSSLGALVGQAKAKTFKKEDVKAKLLAMDSDMDAENLDALIDSLIGVEENPEPETPNVTALAGDTDGAAGVIEFLKGKGLSPEDLDAVSGMLSKLSAPAATDEDPEAMTQKDVDTAMDSLSKKLTSELTKKFQDLEVAKSAVRGTVGDVIGMDSAAGVYRFALDHLKVDHKETPDTGLGNLFKVASALGDKPAPVNTIAADAAIALAIPGLARFS